MARCISYAKAWKYHTEIRLDQLNLYLPTSMMNCNETFPRKFQYFLIQKNLIKTCVTYQGEKLP